VSSLRTGPALPGHPLAGALDAIYRACIWVAGGAIVLMSIIVPVGVVLRYVFGFGAQWPEPIAILLMVVFTFIGAAASYRAGGDIAVIMLTERLPALPRRWLACAMDITMAIVCLFVIGYGARLCLRTMGQTVSELPWLPVGVSYLPIPIGAALTLVFVIERLLAGPQAHRPIVRFGEEGPADAAHEGAN
jgi:TRAP-type C4-dicarboxylate transport system permease small subunit